MVYLHPVDITTSANCFVLVVVHFVPHGIENASPPTAVTAVLDSVEKEVVHVLGPGVPIPDQGLKIPPILSPNESSMVAGIIFVQ